MKRWRALLAAAVFFYFGAAHVAFGGNVSYGISRKIVALTFDDGPRPEVLKKLLPELEARGIKGTFFVNCFQLQSGAVKKIVREMAQNGHSIQNHTYGHGDMRKMEKKFGRAWVLRDIDRCSDEIARVTGERPKFLRPPFWSIWRDLREDIERHGLTVVDLRVDINSEDYLWVTRETERHRVKENVLREITARERAGKTAHIVVFHEIRGTVAILPEVIEALQARGYEFGTVEEVWGR
ncbi:MAG: polysaccharide deacetylase family protein [Candidatus Niyogibacteria bacterium]|nr:polysaccharide deacetylase family protein [Candidatus Niyogibacteria bacterium]